MARIYRKENYGGSFRGSIRGGSFNPVQAYDPSKKIKEETNKKIEDIRTLQRSAQRQANVDQAVFNADVAQSNANMKAFQGLLSLSQTALKTYSLAQEEQEKNELAKMKEETFFAELTQTEETETEPTDTTNEAFQSSESAIQEVGGNNKNLQDALRKDQIDTVSKIQDKKQNIYQSAIGLPGFMANWMESDEQIKLPDGRIITPATVDSQSDLTFVINRGLATWARDNDFHEMDKTTRRKVVLPVAQQLIQSISSQKGALIAANRIEAAKTKAIDTVNMGLSAGNLNLNKAYEDLKTDLFASGAYIGKGLGSAGDDAFKVILAYAINNLDTDLVDKLKSIEKVPGNKGTTFGKIKEAELREAALTIANNEHKQYTSLKKASKIAIDTILNKRFEELGKGEGDQDVEVNKEAIRALKEIPGIDARKAEIEISTLGLNYNPNHFAQLKEARANGATFTNGELTELVKSQDITKQEAQQLGWRDDGVSADTKVQVRLKDMGGNSQIKGIAQSLVMQVFIKNSAGSAEQRKEAYKQVGAGITRDLEDRLKLDIEDWLGKNPEASDAEIRTEIQNLTPIYNKEIDSVEYDFDKGKLVGYRFGGQEIVTFQTNKSGEMVTNATTIDVDELSSRIKDGNLKLNKDIILTKTEMDEIKESITGKGELSKATGSRLNILQDKFGTNTYVIFKSQLKAWDATPVEIAIATGEDFELTEEHQTQFNDEVLSEVSHLATGIPRGFTPRQLRQPNNKKYRDQTIKYLLLQNK